jgi:hypothetical protein
MSERHETHVVDEHPTEETAEAVATVATVAAAEAAAALANETAAAAEIDAAERVRDYAQELDECRVAIQSLNELTNASATADAERERILGERIGQLESSLVESRAALEEIRNHPLLTPRASPEEQAEIAGASGEVTLGPAEVQASSEIGSDAEKKPENPPQKRKRRWI